MITYYLVDTKTDKAALQSPDRSFLEALAESLQYPNWVVTKKVPEKGLQDVTELSLDVLLNEE